MNTTKTLKEPEIVIPPRGTAVPSDSISQLMEGLKRLPHVLNGMGFDSLRPGQDKAVKAIMSQRDTVVILPTATGKCLGKNTPVLMYDGTRRFVQDVRVGDLLASPTGRPNRVISTTCGSSMLYRVDQNIGDPYVVNGAHKLSLRMSPTGKKKKEFSACGDGKFGCEDVANVSVEDYLTASRTFKHRAKGWKSATSFHPELRNIHADLPPYILGVWLGDGREDGTVVTTEDQEIVRELRSYAESVGLYLHEEPTDKAAPAYGVFKEINDPTVPNRMRAALQQVGVLGNKHIPSGYLRATAAERLELLAGLLDTDGSWDKGGYDFIQKRKIVTEGIVELARSVGMRASDPTRCVKTCVNNGVKGVYWRTFISPGNGVLPPCRLRRKVGELSRQSLANTTGVSVTAVGVGDYYGFELDGDHLFLLGDYTVTHNSACFVIPALCMQWRAIIIYPLVALMRDQAASMQRKGLSAASISSQESDAHNASVLRDWASGELQFMLVSPERFANEEWANVVAQFPPDLIAMDEAHTFHDWADTFRHGYKICGQFIQKTQPKVVTALSATLSQEAEKEVREGLGIQDAKLIYHYPRRENLILSSLFLDRIAQAPSWVVDNCRGATIVYASTRKRTESYAEDITRYTNRPVLFYHGGMNQKDRKYNQDKFMDDPDAIIVATNAFGMGVDKPDIRNVVHFDIPGDLIALAQENGRAGRDGNDSYCTLIPTAEGLRTQRHFIRCGNPTPKDIRDFVKAAASMREGRHGAIMAKREDIANAAGIDLFAVQAIMTFCLGEGIFYHDTSAARQHRLRFAEVIPSMTKTEMETRNAIFDVSLEKDGWREFDVEALAEQLEKEPSTVMSRLRNMHEKGFIEWVRSDSRKPLQIGREISEVPKESFDRLAEKAARAESDLQLVMDYADEADDTKHDFLERHLNR